MPSVRVLLVEDERIVALHLRRQLAKLDYEVVASVSSGSEALRSIEELRPDIVLMDIRIEGPIDGIQTTAMIAPELRIPVIYLTAHAEEATLARARETKPYGYLLKPFSESELHATIQIALARSRADATLHENELRLSGLLAERSAELEQQITERLRTEEALRQAQKLEAIGRLTSGIAHDFNNLLTVVVGGLTLLERRIRDERNTQLVSAALEAAQRGAVLTRQLLSFGRRQMVHPTNLAINDSLCETSDLIRNGVGPLVQVEYRLNATQSLCHVDREELERAILNLAVNARQAMPDGGDLIITTDTVNFPEPSDDGSLSAGKYLRLSMRDTGQGMPPNVLDQAFDPYFTTRPLGEGSGLGLSQAYGFAKQSAGHAVIESKVGQGTTVTLLLPLAKSCINEAAESSVGYAPSLDGRVAC